MNILLLNIVQIIITETHLIRNNKMNLKMKHKIVFLQAALRNSHFIKRVLSLRDGGFDIKVMDLKEITRMPIFSQKIFQ